MLHSLLIFGLPHLLHGDGGLLLHHGFVLNHGLLQQSSQSEALFNIRLQLVVSLSVLAQLHVFLQFFDQTVLFHRFVFQIPVLFLQLLHKMRLEIGSFTGDGYGRTSSDVASLLLQLSCQVLGFLLFLLHFDVESLNTGSQPSILILGDVVLDLQVAIMVLDLFLFHRAPQHRLIGLGGAGNIVELHIIRSESFPSCVYSASLVS